MLDVLQEIYSLQKIICKEKIFGHPGKNVPKPAKMFRNRPQTANFNVIIFFIPGATLASYEGCVKVVKSVCSQTKLQFSEHLLTWDPLDNFDSKWEVPVLLTEGERLFGFFTRANSSSCFEDSQERTVDLQKMSEENPKMYKAVMDSQSSYDRLIMNSSFGD